MMCVVVTREYALEIVYVHMPPIGGDVTHVLVVRGVQVRQFAKEELRPEELPDVVRRRRRRRRRRRSRVAVRIVVIVAARSRSPRRQPPRARVPGVTDLDDLDRIGPHRDARPHEIAHRGAVEAAVFLLETGRRPRYDRVPEGRMTGVIDVVRSHEETGWLGRGGGWRSGGHGRLIVRTGGMRTTGIETNEANKYIRYMSSLLPRCGAVSYSFQRYLVARTDGDQLHLYQAPRPRARTTARRVVVISIRRAVEGGHGLPASLDVRQQRRRDEVGRRRASFGRFR